MRKNAANLAPDQASEIVPTPVSGMRATLRLAQGMPILPPVTRVEFDSVDHTSVNPPTRALLAIARGDQPEQVLPPRRRTWFGLGMAAGAVLMWLAIGNVRPTFEATRALAQTVVKWVEDPR